MNTDYTALAGQDTVGRWCLAGGAGVVEVYQVGPCAETPRQRRDGETGRAGWPRADEGPRGDTGPRRACTGCSEVRCGGRASYAPEGVEKQSEAGFQAPADLRMASCQLYPPYDGSRSITGAVRRLITANWPRETARVGAHAELSWQAGKSQVVPVSASGLPS